MGQFFSRPSTPSISDSDSDSDSEPPSWDELAERHKWYFRHTRLVLAKVDEIGFHGGSLIFAEKDNNGNVIRNLNIKYATDDQARAFLRNELLCLRDLRGAEHFQQLISLRDTSVRIAGTGTEHPMIALEHLPCGSLEMLRERVSAEGFLMPNKVLWLVFRCSGMRNAPYHGPDDGLVQEPTWEFAASAITHNRGHGRNFKFGGMTAPGDDEHELLPILKLTDFTRGRREQLTADEEDAYDDAYFYNMRAAGRVMEWFACNQVDEAGLETRERNLIRIHDDEDEECTMGTYAHRVFLKDEGIDPELRKLVARCLAPDGWHPAYDRLALIVDDGARNRDPLDTSIFPEERIFDTDPGMIRIFAQRYLFDADNSSEGIISRSDLVERWRLEYTPA
ncbi:hypothetical protein F4776DRAFT_671028 [Hypoxylon sp. NC0597]|nr:hypothetical protein F4776DRAFT_671028 [Hypoxylon sp. NC0597]